MHTILKEIRFLSSLFLKQVAKHLKLQSHKVKKVVLGFSFINKKGKDSFRITKQRGEEPTFVTALAKDIFTPHLRGLILVDINEASLINIQIKTLDKTVRS